MANRFPLTLNTASKQIEELPSGDNLDLTGSNIVGVGNIAATSLTVNGANVVTTATEFDGDYNSLSNKPTIPTNVSELANDAGYITSQTDAQTISLVGNTLSISNGNSLSLSSIIPTNLSSFVNDTGYISNITLEDLGDLSDVSVAGASNGQALIYNGSSWVPGNVAGGGDGVILGNNYFINIVGEDSTVLVDATNSAIPWSVIDSTPTLVSGYGITDAYAVLDITDTSGVATTFYPTFVANRSASQTVRADVDLSYRTDTNTLTVPSLSVGSIDTSDSSALTILPAVVLNSDLTVENNLVVDNNITAGAITATTITTENFNITGTSTISFDAASILQFQAGDAVKVEDSLFRLGKFTTVERDALTPENGDVIYNTSTNKFQGYASGSWVDLH